MIEIEQYCQELTREGTPAALRERGMILADLLEGESSKEIENKIEANFYKDFIKELSY